MPQYLDQNGNPIPAQPVYLDPNSGEPIPSQAAPRASNEFIDTLSGTAPWQQAIDKAATPEPYQGNSGDVGRFFSNLGAGATALMLEPLAHPVKTAKGLLDSVAMPGPGGTETASGWHPNPATPVPWKESTADLTAAVPGAVAAAVGAPQAAEASEAPIQAVTNGIERAKQWARPTSSPSVVPRSEMAARNLAAAVLPATKDASNFIQAAQQEVPNVLDYAKRTQNPLNTQLEFSKAAHGYAQEVRDVYEGDVLGPSEKKSVKTTGTGFGRQNAEGPDTYATLGEIDKRIGDINKQLDAPAMNADDARRALSSKTQLQAEASALRDILHKNLSEATGLTPEQVADLRQRVGRSYELANDTDAAVTQRMQAVGKAEQAPLVPSQMLSSAWNKFVVGGRVSIADRAFQRAIRNFPGQSEPLPTINPPTPAAASAPARPSLAQAAGVEAEPNPLYPVPFPAEDARAQVATMNRSLARRQAAIEDATAAQKAASAARANRLEQLLEAARKQQDALRRGGQ